MPGSHLPHAWVGDASHKVSTLDLAPYTRFTLITGIAGDAWQAAAAKVSHDLQIPLETVIIGPGQKVTDIYALAVDYDARAPSRESFSRPCRTSCTGRSPGRPPPS